MFSKATVLTTIMWTKSMLFSWRKVSVNIILFLFGSSYTNSKIWFGLFMVNLCPCNFVSSNPDHGVVHSIQRYVVKFISDMRQVGGFLPSTNNTDSHDITEILLKVALNTIYQPTNQPILKYDIEYIFE